VVTCPRTDEVRDEGGVVPGTGAEFEDAFARLGFELVQHEGDDARLGRAGDRRSVGVEFHVDHGVGIGGFERGVGHEEMAGHGTQSCFDRRCAGVARGLDCVDQIVAELFRVDRGCGDDVGHSAHVVG
jgi:hypothetical protein